ncbi:ribonuclease E/G [uncultured Blautia sp.]|uniref:ribonuclease E/G n=1 Tax=uncultured Blautia sp. TaxID=765821 RepID=UPI00280ADCFE|nr:ribonuclease E/G [uncultured Blautia sp.]
MSRLIITELSVHGCPCIVCSITEGQSVMELRLEASGKKSILNNIYVGQVENIASNIKAAFVRFGEGITGYLPLDQATDAIFTAGRKDSSSLRPGDELLVQVCRDAMKGKLPALTTNLNFTGKYLVLTTGNKKIGFSGKLTKEEASVVNKWLEPEREQKDRGYGIIARTNSAEAQKEEFLHELAFLKTLYQKVAVLGRNRTCFSLLYEAEPFYLAAVRDVYSRDLEEIVTDLPEVYERLQRYLQDFRPEDLTKLRFYEDKLLPLCKLYRIEHALEEVQQEKIWLKSGGFLVIQQTEAFVSVDVNSGKYTGKKKAEETYRKINLEAAGEIARQIRLRNLSGIILIDFINMSNPDHQDELFHVLQKYLRKDPVKCRAIDITPLHILEMTRKKVRRPVIEEIRDLTEKNTKF